MKFKRIISYITVFVICLTLSACGNGLSNRKLQKLLRENGYNYDSAKVETVLALDNNINGLDDNGSNKLVLINNNGYYGLAVINIETNKVTIPTFGYIPLNVVQQEIWDMGKDVNIKNASILKKYIEQYGINGLENKEYAEEYLREITGPDGIIQTETAQNIISNSTMSIFQNIKSPDEVTVLFEENSAVPMYYATKSSQMVYNWNQIFSEYVYNIWSVNTDRQTQQTMASIYGPPYVSKTVLSVVNSNLKEIGTFNSLESAKAVLLSKNKKTSNSSTKQESSSEQIGKSTDENKTQAYEKKENEIVIGYTLYEPFAYNDNGLVGFDIDLAKEICKNIGLSPVFVEINWEDRISLLNSGKIDCLWNGLVMTDKLKNNMDLSDVYLVNETTYENSVETEELVIGFKKGSSLTNKFNSELSKMKKNGFVDQLKAKYFNNNKN